MAERTSVTQVVQLGVENAGTPGTSVPATRKLQSITINPGVKVNINAFRPQWDKFSTTAALGREWTEATVAGDPNYNELPYILGGIATSAVPVAGSGPTAGSYLWTYFPSTTAPDAPNTYTVEHGSSVRADKFSFGMFTAFNFAIDRTKFTLSGSMMGQQLQDGITLTPSVKDVKNIHASAAITAGTYTITDGNGNVTGAIAYNANAGAVAAAFAAATPNPIPYSVTGGPLTTPTDFVATANTAGVQGAWTVTPTAIVGGALSIVQGAIGSGPSTVPLVPVIPPQVDVFLDSTFSGIGSTKLTRALGVNYSLDTRFGPLWALNSAVPSWTTFVETAVKSEVKLMLEADSVAMALLADMRAGNTKYVRVRATGPNIPGTTATPFFYQVDAAIKIKDVAPFRDDQGVYAIDFTFDVVDDSAFGGAFNMSVQNQLAAL